MTTRFKRLSGIIRTGGSDLSWRGRCDSIWRVHRFVASRAFSGWNYPWLGAFIREVWRFRTARGRAAVLHYAPELGHEVMPEILLVQWSDELKALEKTFGFRLPRVSVFLFQAVGCVTEIFGPRYGGLALPAFNAIVVGEHPNSQEDVRHELVHLFASRWNLHAPPLLAEGLAVHLQKRWRGYPIATFMRRFGSRSEWTLASLFDESIFFDNTFRQACYVIAGSFSGFLIDEFGWDAYRTLYRSCGPNVEETAFRRSLGISLAEAESRWRSQF